MTNGRGVVVVEGAREGFVEEAGGGESK